ncbi:PREDICTED: uncharacterized protein LOC107330993 isoform X2 [Acropora digitifera]|uniref:uncharacterized protein LOC107330993 isoform X2 n=1 Tax=Acropora digitifera TaxID=70779 RepID=UPI00077B16AA|nr:PREDICTED: uncharacterized protein LOC107330993 isoform X2 [Acropora digitifera]
MNQFNAASNWKLAWTVNIIKKGNAEELLEAFIGNTLLTERMTFVDHCVNPQVRKIKEQINDPLQPDLEKDLHFCQTTFVEATTVTQLGRDRNQHELNTTHSNCGYFDDGPAWGMELSSTQRIEAAMLEIQHLDC